MTTLLKIHTAIRSRVSFQSKPLGFRLFSASAQRDPAATEQKQPEEKAEEPEDVEELSAEDEKLLADLTQKCADLKEKIKIADQDADQASKRHSQQVEDASKYSFSKLARDSLDLADNLKRVTLSVTPEDLENHSDVKQLVDSVKKIRTDLLAVYAEFGIKEEDPVGKVFDPNMHEAMFELPLPHQQTGTVAHVLQTGYLIGDRVLRPARVGVVRN